MKFINYKPEQPEVGQCDQHGEYEFKYQLLGDKYMVLSNCTKCAAEQEAERLAEEKKAYDELHAKKLDDKKRAAGISARHFTCSFTNYKAVNEESKKALKTVSDYCDAVINNSGACLVMAGSVGTGKTHLASAVANKFIESGKRCIFVKMSELIRAIKDTWRKDSDNSETQIIERFSTSAILIIDEIGIQFGSDTEKLLISEIIDNRYQNVLPTVMISNLDIAGIKACIGDRSYDRLKEDGGKVVAFNWDSYRGVK